MIVVHTLAGLKTALSQVPPDHSIGFVPTMGALHEGHGSLICKAIAETDVVVVSIFINPLQFGVNEDLDQYPRHWEGDRRFCASLGVNIVFLPSPAEIYPYDDPVQVLPPPSMTHVLCGKFRPQHFQGVATVVVKLLQLVHPKIAYFGEKDAQQLAIIRRLVNDLHLPVTIRGCPIIREASGLALSSRNQYLSETEKKQAIALFRALQAASDLFQAGETSGEKLLEASRQVLQDEPGITPQYIELVDPETLQPLSEITESGLLAIAVYVGTTRLIDNVTLENRAPIIAIDGPAGAGKSTVTRRVAERLGLLFLDSGAMYRAITWLVLKENIDPKNTIEVAELVSQATVELKPASSPEQSTQVLVNGHDVTAAIRSPDVTAQVSGIAAQAAVREVLVRQQQALGQRGGIVAEGRDIGTNVFPNAELKIFLTATPAERARRRAKDLEAQGLNDLHLNQLEAEIRQRDHLDSTRAIAPLKKADDAKEIVTDGMTINEVVQQIIRLLEKE